METLSSKVKISEPRFETVEPGRAVKCTVEARLNLKELERRYFTFTRPFIKNKLSKHIPVVYSVLSLDQHGNEKCRAKYLLKPDGTAVVMKIDEAYYGWRSSLPAERSTVKASSRIKPRARLMEYSRYDYTSTLSAEATATCHDEDTFDENIGNMVAFAKAYLKLNKKLEGLFHEINIAASNMVVDTWSFITSTNEHAVCDRCHEFLEVARKGGCE